MAYSASQIREVDLIIDLNEGSPTNLHRQITQALGEVLKADALIDISIAKDGPAFSADLQGVGNEIPASLKAALIKLAPALLECEIGSMELGYKISGRMTFDREGSVFLDAEDFEKDWDYQRSVSIEYLYEVEFEPSEEGPDLTIA